MQVFNSINDEKLIELIKTGAVGVLPTDTVYGLVCDAANQESVARLYSLKLREHKPGTVVAANIDQLVKLGIKHRYLKAVEQFWPGAISIIIPSGEELTYLHQGLKGLAIRVPRGADLQDLLEKTGPLLTTSANLPGEAPANTMAEAQKYFEDKLDYYVDGGDLSGHKPSTVIRVVDDAIEVLREGAVKVN